MNDIGRQTAEVLAAHYPASDALLRRTAVIAERLAAVNPHMNLTALTSPEEMALLHVYDSLALLSAAILRGNASWTSAAAAASPRCRWRRRSRKHP